MGSALFVGKKRSADVTFNFTMPFSWRGLWPFNGTGGPQEGRTWQEPRWWYHGGGHGGGHGKYHGTVSTTVVDTVVDTASTTVVDTVVDHGKHGTTVVDTVVDTASTTVVDTVVDMASTTVGDMVVTMARRVELLLWALMGELSANSTLPTVIRP